MEEEICSGTSLMIKNCPHSASSFPNYLKQLEDSREKVSYGVTNALATQ